MKKIYFFVHIPKTAGTSFRIALQKNESVRMLYDYGERSIESSPELRDIGHLELVPDNPVFHVDKYNFLCGHVNYGRYAHCVAEENVVSIVRNPVERIVSEYQHLKRHGGLDCNFEDFCANAYQQNKQSRILKGLKSGNGSLIGLTSHYKYFVELFCDKFALPLSSIIVNTAPISDMEERSSITPDEIKQAYKLNKKDMVLFFQKAQHFSESVVKAGYNTTPASDAVWNCRVDNNKRVVGWFPCNQKDCFFIVLKVNEEKRAIISLDQCRKDICEKGMSENPMCGFSYPLSLLGVNQGDSINVGILGSKKFKKLLFIE